MDRRTLLAFSLMALVYLGWIAFFAPKPAPPTEQAASELPQSTESKPGEVFQEAEQLTAEAPAAVQAGETRSPSAGWLSAA